MPKNIRFADDGWAYWEAGNDTSTIYLHEWVNPNAEYQSSEYDRLFRKCFLNWSKERRSVCCRNYLFSGV